MNLTGTLMLAQKIEKRTALMFLINEDVGDLDDIRNKPVDIKVTEHREKRGLSANAYFHVLVDKLQKRLSQDSHISFAAVKNNLICEYGQIWFIDDVPAVYKTNVPPEVMIEQEEPHAKLFRTGQDGAYWYRLYRGSHTYNSKEMYQLIQGTIQECKQVGIETMTPNELMRLEGIGKAGKG